MNKHALTWNNTPTATTNKNTNIKHNGKNSKFTIYRLLNYAHKRSNYVHKHISYAQQLNKQTKSWINMKHPKGNQGQTTHNKQQ